MSDPPRKTVRHFNEPGHARGLTFSTYQRVRVLDCPSVGRLVLTSIRRACERQSWNVLAYVLMPDHVHLLVFPRKEPEVSRLLFAIKRPSSQALKRMLERSGSDLLDRLSAETSRGHSFRLWQAGGGHDRNLWSSDALRNTIEYIHLNPVRAKLCAHPREWALSSWRQWHEPDRALEEWEPRVTKMRL